MLERKPSLRGEVVERTLALREGESLRLGVLKALLRSEELRLELRLELLNELLRLDELLELLRLELLNELCPLLLRLLLIDELLWLLPPPRLPPPRCARAGVALSARAIITRVIAFEVFMLLLLSFFGFIFWCKNTTIIRVKFLNLYLFFPRNTNALSTIRVYYLMPSSVSR